MAITDSITQARQKGATDDQIIAEIAKQNPQKAASFQAAQQKGADATTILNEVLKQNQSAPVVPPSTPLSVAGEAIGNVASTFVGGLKKIGTSLAGGATRAVGALGKGDILGAGRAVGEAALGTAAGGVQAFYSPEIGLAITAAQEIDKATGGAISGQLKQLAQDNPQAVLKVQDFINKHPQATTDVADLLSIVGIKGVAPTIRTAGKEAASTVAQTARMAMETPIAQTIKETISPIVQKNIITPIGDALAPVVDKITPNAAQIMQRVARVSKGQQASFEKTAGESIGQYLDKRGIYGNIDTISQKLADRFTSSKSEADTALATLKGNFQATPIKTALTELFSRETRVSSPGALSKDFKRVRELKNKYDKSGLTMPEINEVKRLYERNVKLDFVKQNLPENVAKATNLDNALREWQFGKAEKLGLKNLPDINKETRLSKQLLDSIGKEYSGAAGNNAVGLSDWIVLSGGDPTAVSAFLVKKGFSSKTVQSAIAKIVSKSEKIGTPKAEFGTPKPGLQELIQKYPIRTTQQAQQQSGKILGKPLDNKVSQFSPEVQRLLKIQGK